MKLKFPAYVVAEVPPPVSEEVQRIRDALDSPLAKLPVEISLGGSSGVGPIPVGTDVTTVKQQLDRLFANIRQFQAAFSRIEAFPGGSCVYLALVDRGPFDAIHNLLRKSEIVFSESPFPYTPHCSLRIGPQLNDEETAQICKRTFPTEPFEIHEVSLYSLNHDTWECALLHRVPLLPSPTMPESNPATLPSVKHIDVS